MQTVAQDGLLGGLSLGGRERFEWLRTVPGGTRPGSDAALAVVDAWLDASERDPAQLAAGRALVDDWLCGTQHVGFLADLGVLSADGFVVELHRRLLHKLLPEDLDSGQLRDCLRGLFGNPRVAAWWGALPLDRWQRIASLLGLIDLSAPARRQMQLEWVESVKVLSARVAATGVDPLVARVYPNAQRSASPFLEQQAAVRRYIDACLEGWSLGSGPLEDDRPVHVLIGQCMDVIHRIRRNTVRTGVTVRLTYRLQRLEDTIARLVQLLGMIDPAVATDERRRRRVEFLRQQVKAVGEQARLRPLWRTGTHLAAREVVSHAGRTGEHYMARDRSQWWGILRAASIGGALIALLAIVKIQILGWHAPPLVEGVLVALNYGLGFVLIHVLHGTVATKQPAMTAARIAAAAGSGEQRSEREARERLVGVVMDVARGQWTAVLGNVAIALPLAVLLTWGAQAALGLGLADAPKSRALLDQLDPLGGTFFFAAIAGVCLFFSGVVSGYCDNLGVFHRLPRRVARMPLLLRWLGPARAARIGAYVEHNFGAIIGNFLFGCLLGTISMTGHLSGLPVDIRHVAFASANLGVAGTVLWPLEPRVLLGAAVVVAGIGLVNLMVSFVLSLLLALRAQERSLWLLVGIGRDMVAHLLRHPLDPFRLPLAAEPAADGLTEASGQMPIDGGASVHQVLAMPRPAERTEA
jgi:site-specific recombinase